MNRSLCKDNAERTRLIYEQRPYPAADEKALKDARWRLAPMEWMNALWKPGREKTAPERILIAGCGSGSEAFAMRRRFPAAEIVAVDFSPRSIAIARDVQRCGSKMKEIRFLVGDLAGSSLSRTVGRGFDFVSCHGVLSYIPEPGRVLKHLGGCLNPDGAFYLGVNGVRHQSTTLRQVLPAFGFDMAELCDGPHLRKALALADTILGLHGADRISKHSAAYLAGDVFGPLIQNLALDRWIRIARAAGLSFQGSFHPWQTLRRALEQPSSGLLIPRSRAGLCQLVDKLLPEGFHRILFTLEPVANPPWENHAALLAWRPVLTTVYDFFPPKRSRSWQALRKTAIKSPATNTRLDWQMPEWELEILRQCNGKRSVGEIIGQIPVAISPELLKNQLYVLYQFFLINLLSPETVLPDRLV